MSDYPNAYRIDTSTQPTTTPSCSTPWFLIILLIIAFLIIAGLVVAIVFLFRRKNKDRVIEFKGANIKVASPTSLIATWPSTGKTNDKVTLWATLQPPQFANDGSLTNSNASKAVATSGSDTVTLSGLQENLKYYATVVVTNPDTSNYQVHTQLVYMSSVTPAVNTLPTTPSTSSGDISVVPNLFAIEDMLQVGKIQLETDGGVRFNQRPSEANSLWQMNNDGQIVSNGNRTMCLYNNNGSLAAHECADLKTNNLSNSKWVYNQGKYANQWCLANTVNQDSPTCMVLGPISSGTAVVTVSNNTSVGDSWVNAFETTSS